MFIDGTTKYRLGAITEHSGKLTSHADVVAALKLVEGLMEYTGAFIVPHRGHSGSYDKYDKAEEEGAY